MLWMNTNICQPKALEKNWKKYCLFINDNVCVCETIKMYTGQHFPWVFLESPVPKEKCFTWSKSRKMGTAKSYRKKGSFVCLLNLYIVDLCFTTPPPYHFHIHIYLLKKLILYRHRTRNIFCNNVLLRHKLT